MATRKNKVAHVGPQTYDEWLAHETTKFESTLDFAISEPSFILQKGDSVIYGKLKDCMVEEVLQGGKWYHISYHDISNIRGKEQDNGRRPRLVPWYSIILLSGVQNERLSNGIRFDNWTSGDVSGILVRHYHFGIDPNPEYQRGYAWTLEDKQQLIHSIMQHIDIGKMVFINYEWSADRPYGYEILDGKQRLNALVEFFEGRFTYKGLTYQQLCSIDRRVFKDTRIQYVDVSEHDMTTSRKLQLFLSVNIAGVPQSAEHIAHIQRQYDESVKDGALNDTR